RSGDAARDHGAGRIRPRLEGRAPAGERIRAARPAARDRPRRDDRGARRRVAEAPSRVIPSRAMSCAWRAALVALLCFAGSAAATSTVLDRIVATVDGDPITAHEIRRFGEDRRAHNVSEEELLDAVITDRILAKEIAARKISAKSEEID